MLRKMGSYSLPRASAPSPAGWFSGVDDFGALLNAVFELLLKQRSAPLPYTTPIAELDVRPGGANLIVMRDPQGNDLPNRGVYLEAV